MRQRLRRAAPGPECAEDGPAVGGGIDAGAAEAADTLGSGPAAVGAGLWAAGAPHTVQKAVSPSSAVPH